MPSSDSTVGLPARVRRQLKAFRSTMITALEKRAVDFKKLPATKLAAIVAEVENSKPTPNPDRANAMQHSSIMKKYAEDDERVFNSLPIEEQCLQATARAIEFQLEPSTLSRVLAAHVGISHPLIKDTAVPERKLIKQSESQMVNNLAAAPGNIALISAERRAKLNNEQWTTIIEHDAALYTWCPIDAEISIIKHVCSLAIERDAKCLVHYQRYSKILSDENFDVDIYASAIQSAIDMAWDKVLQYVPGKYQPVSNVILWATQFPNIVRYARIDLYSVNERLALARHLMKHATRRAPALIMGMAFHDYLRSDPDLLAAMIASDPTCTRHVCSMKVFTEIRYWIAALKRCPAVFKVFPDKMRSAQNAELELLARVAVKLLPENLQYVEQQSEVLVALAVASDQSAAQYIKDPALAAKFGADRISQDLFGRKSAVVE